MMRLIAHCGMLDPIFLPSEGGERVVEWHLITWKLWREIVEVVPKSHGAESELAKDVDALVGSMKDGFQKLERLFGGEERYREVAEEEWAMLRARLD